MIEDIGLNNGSEGNGTVEKSSGEGARPTDDRGFEENHAGRPPSADKFLWRQDFFNSFTVTNITFGGRCGHNTSYFPPVAAPARTLRGRAPRRGTSRRCVA
jgi:hypothetical protein